MSQGEPFNLNDVQRQLRRHVESLRAAGVEWLPRGEPLPLGLSLGTSIAPAAESLAAETPAAESSLFEIAPTSSASELSLESRRQALAVLTDEVKKCMKCAGLASTRTQTVFGQGQVGVELCFVGEAPGADEDAQGLPFVGAAGQLLNKIIAACGMKREEIYICNIIKCRPPGNRTPLPDEASNCRGFLERQLELIQPKFICALGTCAATNLLNTTKSLGMLRGKFHDYKGIPAMVTYHPAYLLPHRSPEKKREVWEDMKMLLARMGRPVPAKA
ncbi:MAG: uracil-DNA glycosylase [Planctomycetes bacterium]|nr:uracil-DNA glycosylase [Planctomycetota bacterium]